MIMATEKELTLQELADRLVNGLPPLAKAAVGLSKLIMGYTPQDPKLTLPDPAGGCSCTPHWEDHGAYGSELQLEPDPACPVHSEHLYDPRSGVWVLRDRPIEECGELVVGAPCRRPAGHDDLDNLGCMEAPISSLADHFAADLETDEPDDGGKLDGLANAYADPAQEWQSWPMITAGDGRNYERLAPAEGAARWRQVGYHWRLNTAEILAMGDVRRAAVITLPDEVPEFDEYLIAGPEKVKTFAAELFAAALHAEEGDR